MGKEIKTDEELINRYYNGEKLESMFPNNGFNKLYKKKKKYLIYVVYLPHFQMI